MVRHIVLFRLKESLSQAEKRDIAVRFKTAIEALPEVIGFIGKIEVGLNINEDEKFDIALYSEFETLDEVKAYSAHPSHVAAAGILTGHVDERACVDF
jgi:heme-degrading monooxygenase HmoA